MLAVLFRAIYNLIVEKFHFIPMASNYAKSSQKCHLPTPSMTQTNLVDVKHNVPFNPVSILNIIIPITKKVSLINRKNSLHLPNCHPQKEPLHPYIHPFQQQTHTQKNWKKNKKVRS